MHNPPVHPLASGPASERDSELYASVGAVEASFYSPPDSIGLHAVAQRDDPILLFGMPRSGTTWVAKILDSDATTVYRHEPDSFGRMNFLPQAPAIENIVHYALSIRLFYYGLPALHDNKVAAKGPLFNKTYLNAAQHFWNAGAISGSRFLGRLSGGNVSIPLWLPQKKLNQARLVAKSIESVARMGVIARALPKARLILLLRHPMGFIASMLRGKQHHYFTDSASIGEDIRLMEHLSDSDVGRDYEITHAKLQAMTPVQRLAWQWVLANDKALRDTESCSNVTILRYEDLCNDPFNTAESLFDWCNLELGRQTRRFIERSTSTHSTRFYSVFKDSKRAANGWLDELDELSIATADEIVRRSKAGRLFKAEGA